MAENGNNDSNGNDVTALAKAIRDVFLSRDEPGGRDMGGLDNKALLELLDDSELKTIALRTIGPKRGRPPTRDKLIERLLVMESLEGFDPPQGAKAPEPPKPPPPKASRAKSGKVNNGANLGFEDKMWAAADKLRG